MSRFSLITIGLATACWTWPATSSAEVSRCGNTYSHTACADGQRVELQAPVEVHRASNIGQIFLCRLGTQQFWSNTSCQSRNASMLYQQAVPNHWNWEEQVRHAQQGWQAMQSRNTPSVSQRPVPMPSAASYTKRQNSSCAALQARVDHINALRRQGGSTAYMERLRQQRKDVIERMSAQGC